MLNRVPALGGHKLLISIQVKDILQAGTDIIVFSAHPSLLGGSGVSGIVHRAAGPELELFVKSLGPISPGESIITPAFKLPAKYIIHTVCPRYIYGTREEEELLALAYKSALSLKRNVPDASSIAFVSLGTGVYRWPLEVAARIAITELSRSEFQESVMCVTDEMTAGVYEIALSEAKS